MPRAVDTTCPYCGVGCGVRIAAGQAVSGDSKHPANHGKLCVKGSALHETLGNHERLLTPTIEGKAVSWAVAIDRVATEFNRIIAEHGPDAVAFYVSGQLLTEDYYAANKLMKGYIGSANIDTNSRLCMSSAVAAYKRAFGEDVVPACYEDLELADLVILTGSNTAWAHPIVYQRIAAAKQLRPEMRVVVIDPRRTATCDIADLHLAIAPGSDGWLFTGLLAWLDQEQYLDQDYIDAHTRGFDQTLAAAQAACPTLEITAAHCEISVEQLKTFYRWFARTQKVVTVFSQGINQSDTGTDKGNAIINVHLATGRVGLPGASPFSMTGQPNAMGGREVGGLANQLAAHLDIENPLHRGVVQDFWHSPTICREPGLKAVDMFEAVANGRIKAIWIMATNPVVSMPEADKVLAALQQCEFVVVSDCVASTDTTACAKVLLPAAAWGEKNGTVTNSERCISRQRSFLSLPGEARPDWWIISQVGQRMGFEKAFSYQSPAEIFREHAALSALAAQQGKVFDISALADISDRDYDAMLPQQWPVRRRHQLPARRLFGDGRFARADGRAVFVPVIPALPKSRSAESPLCLNTGRIRDQWHTMTRTGRAPRLFQHIAEPFVEMHPDALRERGLTEGQLVEVISQQGSSVVRLVAQSGQRPADVFMPIHWTDQFASRARVDALVAARTDPWSGQPAFKQTPVEVKAWKPLWQGVALALPGFVPGCEFWARSRLQEQIDGWVLAGKTKPDKEALKASLHWPVAELLEVEDPDTGHWRLLALDANAHPVFWLAWSDSGVEADTLWLAQQFGKPLAHADRLAMLAGCEVAAGPDLGPVICSCFQVRRGALEQLIADGSDSVESLGRACNAGTNCGSCVPELRALLTTLTEIKD